MAIIALLAAILFPVFARAREQARSASCQNNLRQIGLALQLYAEDHDGAFPPVSDDLTPLIPRYLQEPGLFSCPSSMLTYVMVPGEGLGETGRLPWDEKAEPPNEVLTSYRYLGGRTASGRGDLGLAADLQRDAHAGRGNVLLVNGRVLTLTPSEQAAHGFEEPEVAQEPAMGVPGQPPAAGSPTAPMPGPPAAGGGG